MRHLLLTGAGLALAALGLTSLPGLAEEKPSVPAPAADETGVEWVDGWLTGQEKARHTDRLMLVYVHRTSPP